MTQIDRARPVMVSGASGYLASWMVKMLLEDGVDVHATVRDLSNSTKVEPLKAAAHTSPGNLKLFESDLMEKGSFDEPMQDCELVFHAASPFLLTGISNPEQEVIQPAMEGTCNILASANKNQTVKRIVHTSSVVANFGDNVDIELTKEGIFTEDDWNQTSSADHQPYPYAKTLAEKEAWSIAGQQDRWDLLTILPGWILGPSLSKRKDSASIKTMIEYGNGTFKSGVPDIAIPMVDVRDVATAHIRAGFTPEAGGRNIVVSEVATLMDIANILRENFGDAYPFPKRLVPKLLFWLIAPMVGRTRKYVSRNVGIPIKIDNSRSKTDLNMSYLPFEQTIRDHFQQILDDGLLAKS